MPAGFLGVENDAQLWVPFAQWAPPDTMARRGNRGFFVLGRLRPGVTLEAAQSEADTVASRLAREYPTTNEARGIEVSPLVAEYFGRLRLAVRLLMAAIAFVLIIVCANVANLLIARSEVRRREIALRVAIGAGRARLLQQLVTESCVLTALGATGGSLLAEVTVRLLMTQSPVPLPISFLPGLDARAAVFTIAVSLVCGIAVGLAPWFQIRIADLSARLKESSRGSDGPRSQRLRNSLVVAEVALAIVLVVGASLMIQSVRKLAAVDPGFDPAVAADGAYQRAECARRRARPARRRVPSVTGRELLDRIGALPGVAAVALGNDVPLDGNSSANGYAAEGQGTFTAQNRPRTYVHRVSPGFFATMRIPFVRGRTFLDGRDLARAVERRRQRTSGLAVLARTGSDREADKVRRDRFGRIRGCRSSASFARSAIAASRANVTAILTFTCRSRIATRRSPSRSAPPCHRPRWLPRCVRRSETLNASIPLYGIAPMDERVHRQSSLSRFITWVMGVFAGMALWLCALGHLRRDVVRRHAADARDRHPPRARRAAARSAGGIVSGGARLIVAGVVIGSLAAFGLRRVVSAQFFDVPLTDPAAGIALALFVLVGLAACFVPGLRATRLDPVRALHQE